MNGRLHDIRCVACGGTHLNEVVSSETYVRCEGCGREYHSALGVLFFGDFEEEDILGLIEIAANVENRGKFGVTPAAVESWEALLRDYHRSPNKDEFVSNNPLAQTPYFLNRYGEWLEIKVLTEGLDLSGCKVLDIGAGLGFDSHRLAIGGAEVTALEFSPLLVESGQQNFPHMRWFGGFSHCLPFQDNVFDAVFCNAALHHMRDIPAAISEALRVLKPNGTLITTCDSFRSNKDSDDAELEIFGRDPADLMGVNECIPKLSEFISLLQKHSDKVDVDLYTHILYNALGGGTDTELRLWSIKDDANFLGKRSGSIAMRVRLKGDWPNNGRLQTAGNLSVHHYVSWLTSSSSAVANLAPLMPLRYVDLEFSGKRGSKFELLNGWLAPQKYQNKRSAYRRGRWFLKRPVGAKYLTFDLAIPHAEWPAEKTVSISVNGIERTNAVIRDGNFKKIEVPVSDIIEKEVFCVEIKYENHDHTFDGSLFDVKSRKFSFLSLDDIRSQKNYPLVNVVIPIFNRLGFTRQCIRLLQAQTYPNLRIILSDGGSTDGSLDVLRSEFPGLTFLTSEDELWWSGSMALGIDHVLRGDSQADDYILMMNNDTEFSENFVEALVEVSSENGAAVGALIVDSRDHSRVLDAGEYIDWETYTFPVRQHIEPDERYCDDVDVLPGRGSIVPIHMIRSAGNVDAGLLPHYLADYEFFCRLKQHGFKLGVTYETRVMAYIEETGIVPTQGRITISSVWKELFSRRSMSNVRDHWRFISRHAPQAHRNRNRMRLIMRVVVDLTLRTQLRPAFLPFYWLAIAPFRTIAFVRNQGRIFRAFGKLVATEGFDVLCMPEKFPGLIRAPLYIAAATGPLQEADIRSVGLDLQTLRSRNILRPLESEGWYALTTLDFSDLSDRDRLKRLRMLAWNPIRKISYKLDRRRSLRVKQ